MSKSTRERLIRLIDDWGDEPGCYEDWDSVLKVNILIAAEKEFGVTSFFNSADIPGITGLESLLTFMEPRISRKKVLVLDCDGVLWDGLAGEGTATMTDKQWVFQQDVSDLECDGVLLCLCSKNNPEDVHETWKTVRGGLSHVQMCIYPQQIVAEEISWDSKVDGLKRLAAKLNLGLDSFVFVDDSPIERAEVLARLPEVTVLDTVEPLTPYFTNLPGKSLTEQYRLRQTVQTAMDEASDRQAFLDSLDMRAVMRVNDESLAPRIAELSQKTNQFNMTLRRFAEADLRWMMNKRGSKAFCASLVDRFGDAGWVAMAVFTPMLETWQLEDFCVSCRVLGRGFERAFIEKCLSALGNPYCQLYYKAGPKNAVCSNFFDGQKVAEHVPRAPVKWEE